MHAVLADIHGNVEALTAVLDDVRAFGIERIICLGDLIGFGPDPAACIDLAMDFDVVLRGCFDHRLFEPPSKRNSTSRALTELDLRRIRRNGRGGERLAFLRQLPLQHETDGVLYAHSFPVEEDWRYFAWVDSKIFGAVERQRKVQGARVAAAPGPVLVGHMHAPGVYPTSGRFRPAREFDHRLQLEPGVPLVVDVGSVGWPRDGDPRACYAIVDGQRLSWQRVEFRSTGATERLMRVPLPPAMDGIWPERGFW